MPMAIAAPVPLVAPATDTAAPTASAVVFALFGAVRGAEPAHARTLSLGPPVGMNAAPQLLILFLASGPPPRPLPWQPEPGAGPPMVSASMLSVESALRLTSPAAFTVEFSMVALTDCPAPLPISLSATDAPTAPDGAGPLPLVAAMLIAKPPASEWILEPSLAPRYTVPAVLLAVLSLMEGQMVVSTLLLAPEPALG